MSEWGVHSAMPNPMPNASCWSLRRTIAGISAQLSMKEKGSPGSQRGKGRRHSLNVGTTHRVGPPLPLQHKSLTGDASIGLLAGVMSPPDGPADQSQCYVVWSLLGA